MKKSTKVRTKRWAFGKADAIGLRAGEKSVNVTFTADEFARLQGAILAANTWIHSLHHGTRSGKRRGIGLTFHFGASNDGYVIVSRGKLSQDEYSRAYRRK